MLLTIRVEKNKNTEKKFNPFNAYRIGAIIIVLAGSMLLSLYGKQHLLVFENMDYLKGGKSLPAFDSARVVLSGGAAMEIEEDDYGESKFVGPFCSVHVETERDGIKSVAERNIYLGFKDYFEFNIPEFVDESSLNRR